MRSAIRIVALTLVLAALAVLPAGTELRAHSPGSATLTALTVTAGATAQTLVPAFDSDDDFYTVWVANSVSQVTVAGTPDGDATATTDQQVTLPTLGAKRVNVVVSHRDSGTTTTQTYTVLIIREGTAATDRAALMALYNSTGGANWTMNMHWGSSEPLGDWFNVLTDSNGRVIQLALGGNNLVGTVPAALGNLDQMGWLYLWGNQLTGAIPGSLGNLAKLQHLYLNSEYINPSDFVRSRLTGSIPASLGDLTNLTDLSLWGNQLTGAIPDSLGNLASLEKLYLGGNGLYGSVPASLGNLGNLLELTLWGNRLEGALPDSLGNLTNLTWLDISRNSLSGQIPDLGRLTSLQWLYLYQNALSGEIPDSLGNLASLVHLYLDTNALEGAIPATLGDLGSLKHLYLNRNALSGTIPDLDSLTSLTRLRLNLNRLGGEIPDSLNSLTSLFELSLNSNQLSGPIPDLNSLTNLKYLYLDHNQLSGPIPDLSALTALERLWLHSNDLEEEIPTSLNELTKLTSLVLESNELAGMIPDLSALEKLTTLSLWNNQLTGPIPAWLGTLTAIDLNDDGNTDDEGDTPGLQGLYLSGNQLSGGFPAALGNLTNLQVTRFASNLSLTGCVPIELRHLVTAADFESSEFDPARTVPNVPAQDFIADDANSDGDTDDPEDTPGLNLPFCMLSALNLSGVTLDPSFASGTVAYTADVANTVESTTVAATRAPDANDRVSIMKGTTSYANGAAVPLAVGPNEITVTVTPTDGTPTLTYTVTILRAGADRATLMALYNSAGGASWTNKDNWGSNEPLNDWFGVTADGSENVTDLDLSGNNLRGTLPADLGTLSHLITLDLSDNQLSGTIPDLSALIGLMTLNLRDNQLSGTIPDSLSSLLSLTTLNLGENRLTGAIPEELGDIFLLDFLYLDNNQLSGPIPVWVIGQITGLQVTRFAGNALTRCVPNGLRYLVTAEDYNSLPAHDFIAVDANDDGDTDDDGDTPGLGLPFCTLISVTLTGVTLVVPVLPDDVLAATAAHTVTSTTVTASLYNSSDTVTIMNGMDSYASGDPVPLDVGPNVITIEVTPADNTPTHTRMITVTRAPNTPPAFDEGETTTRGVDENTPTGVDIGGPVAASDTENDTLTYSLDATSAESFDIDASSGQLRTKADLDHETKASYTATVSVRDGKNDNGDADEVTDDTITVTILVADLNDAPEFPIGETDTRSVDEKTVAGEDIGAPVSATDDDGDTLTYTLDVSSRASFDIVSTTGQLQTKAALDYETGTNSYTVTVTATDPLGAGDTIMVSITVNNVDEKGRVTLSTTQPIEGRPVIAMVDDPDGVTAGSITWSWRRAPTRTALGTIISGATSDSYTPVTADELSFLRTTASYTDGEGSDKSAYLVSTNRVQPAPVGPNEPPKFPPTETGLRSVDENTPPGMNIGEPVAATDADDDTLTYSLDAPNLASFDIVSATGQLQTKAALDYESGPTSHTVYLTATDTAGEENGIFVTITVNNVDEAGTVTLSSLQPLVAIPLTATLADPDRVSSNVTWSWTRSPNGASDWTLISGADSASYTPVAGDVADYLQATATYTDEEGPTKSAQAISANAVEVGPGRNAPMFTEASPATRSVTRNTPAGRNIGAPVSATDADNDALTYSLGGRDQDAFDIDTSSGQLLTKVVLTGALRTIYEVIVSVRDGKDDDGNPEPDPQVDATTEVTINVTTPRRSGGGGGGFSAGPGEIQLVVTAAVVGEEAPAGQRFAFAFNCTPPEGQPPAAWTFSLGAGQASGRFAPGEIPCTLTVTDDGGADRVDGLFTDMVLGEENLRLVVTFTYGIVTTAVDPTMETVVEDAGISLTIPEGSRDAPYAVLLETAAESCEGALDLEGEVIACFTVTVFDADGAEETGVTLLVPATTTITLDAVRVEELGGIDGVRAARERGELRMLQRDDAESPWQELPFTVGEADEGWVEIVVSVQAFGDFALVTATPRLQTIALHAGWTVVVWDGADGASIPDALAGLGASAGGSDVSAQVGVIYQWVAETQTWRSHRPGAPPIVIAFDTFTRGASYWIRSSEAVEWTVVGGPLEPPAAEPTRLHPRWTEVVWRGADGAGIAEAFGADVFPQVEVIYRWLAETQTWGSFRPGVPAFLNAFDTFASGGSYWVAVAEGVEWMVGSDGSPTDP